MAAFPRFDPYALLTEDREPTRTLADLATLAGADPQTAALREMPAACDPFDDMPAAKNQDRGRGPAKVAKPAKADGDAAWQVRFGLPEIPEEPLLLRDGRRLWRFRAGEDTEREQAAELINQAHWHGAVLVADGCELVVVERWLSNLPRAALVELRRCASGVIAELLSHARAPRRTAATSGLRALGLDPPPA